MFRKIFREVIDNKVLGRWARTNEKINGIKVYWANMDHCGPCGKEVVDRRKNTEQLTGPSMKPKTIPFDKK